MSAAYGKVDEFDEGTDDWVEYTERLEQFFLANEIDDATQKKAILLSSCGSKTYSLFRNLLAPVAPSAKTYAELVTVMKEHKIPKPSIILERFKFFKRDRENSESIATYISELRKLTRECDFGTTLEDMLRDRLVCGIRNDKIQQRLLSQTTLSFAQAVSLSTAMERAEGNLKDLHESQVQDLPVHALKSPTKCFRCGKTNHIADKCRFKNAECYVCRQRGHIAPVCKQRTNRVNVQNPYVQRNTANRVLTTNCIEGKNNRVQKGIPQEETRIQKFILYTRYNTNELSQLKLRFI